MNDKTFWVVWQPESGNPSVRHPSRRMAEEEARRLAGVAPSKSFYVLEAVSVSRNVSVTTEQLYEELPF